MTAKPRIQPCDSCTLFEMIKHVLPTAERSPPREMRIEHLPGTAAHFRNSFHVHGQAYNGRGKRLGVTRLDHDPAFVLAHKPRNFTMPRGDSDNRSARGRDTVEIAGHDQPLELRPQ